MKTIDIKETIYQMVKENQEIELILFKLGFTDIVKPGMLQTVGRFMTLKQGSQMKKIPLEDIIKAFKEQGYHIVEDK